MKKVDVEPFVESLGVSIPPVERFWKLGDLTALRQDNTGRSYRANYERGILLYALIAKYRPQTVLEFGTGRGYGCLCMAWSMEDYGIPGRIFTIDMTPAHERFSWPIDWDDGTGPRVETLARNDVWRKTAPASWLGHVNVLTGFSGQVMSAHQLPKIDLAFIDGGHGYEAVRHDFYSVLNVAADRFGILFDDYAPMPGFGIQKLIDNEVAPHFDATLIYTDRRWFGGERTMLTDPEYGMVWAHSSTLHQLLANAYPLSSRSNFLRTFRTKELASRLRRWLGQLRHR